jgi:hypothetical protein
MFLHISFETINGQTKCLHGARPASSQIQIVMRRKLMVSNTAWVGHNYARMVGAFIVSKYNRQNGKVAGSNRNGAKPVPK